MFVLKSIVVVGVMVPASSTNNSETQSVQWELKNSNTHRIALGVTFEQLGMLVSVEHGFAIFRQMEADKEDTEKVHIYDLAARKVVTVNPIDNLPDADEVSLYQASVGPTGLLALVVCPVARSESGELLTNLLMIYDSEGRLQRVRRTSDENLVHVRVDENDTIWGLSRGSSNADVATTFLLFKYTRMGGNVDSLYPRLLAPGNEVITPYVRGVGASSFGLTADHVYCWMPKTQEMILMAKDGSSLERFAAEVPRPAGLDSRAEACVLQVQLSDSRRLYFDVIYRVPGDVKTNVEPVRFLFVSELGQNDWKKLTPRSSALPLTALVGLDGERALLMSVWSSPNELAPFQLFRLPAINDEGELLP